MTTTQYRRKTTTRSGLRCYIASLFLAPLPVNVHATSPAGTSDHLIEWLDFYLSALGVLGATIVFGVGWYQYRRAQKWKRTEFVAKEYKELLQDRRATNALAMIDWASRDIRLHAAFDPKDPQLTRVTRDMQCRALLPHSFKETPAEATGEYQVSLDGAQLRRYSEVDALIRDCYDGLLDRLDRLGNGLQQGLLTRDELTPYVGYYLDDIAKPTNDSSEALCCIGFLTYVHFYNFIGVRALFKGFDHDTQPDGAIFAGFVAQVAPESRPQALQLQGAARRGVRKLH